MPDLSIDNQEIIPVRMIPYVTGWLFAPDEVIKILSDTETWHKVFIPSFHMMPDNSYQPMLPKEWDVFELDLEALENSLHNNEQNENDNYHVWRQRAIEVIPTGTFVWLKDLKIAYQKANSHTLIVNERPGDRELNLQPYMNPEMRRLVFEGFHIAPQQNKQTSNTYEENQPQDVTISFDDLHDYMLLDPFYGYSSAVVLSIVNRLYKENASNDLFVRFDEKFSLSPFKKQPVRHLIYIWCGLMGLPTYLNGKPSKWKRDDFIEHLQVGFELNLSELKSFLRFNKWPLPVELFPNEIDNTENKVSMDGEKFEQAFNDYTVVLPKLESDLKELKSIPPESMEARQQKKAEIEKIEQQIASIHSGDYNNKIETPAERKQRLEAWFHEEKLKNERGALKRTAERENITRQSLKEILNR